MTIGSPAIGICARDIPGATQRVTHLITEAAALRVDAIQFSSLLDLSPTLDPGELAGQVAVAASHGLEVWAGAGDIGRYHPDRARDLLRAGGGDPFKGAGRIVRAAADVGIHDLAVTLGREEDRFQPGWPSQLLETAAWLRELSPLLASTGSRLVIKTHEELTTRELMDILADLDPTTFVVGFDPTNCVVRMELPRDALMRVDGHVHTIHLDDVYLCPTADGLARRPAPLGRGDLDWPRLLPTALQASRAAGRPARLLIDLHRADLRMPYRDPEWLRHHPDLTAECISRITAVATVDRPAIDDIDVRRETALTWLRQWIASADSPNPVGPTQPGRTTGPLR